MKYYALEPLCDGLGRISKFTPNINMEVYLLQTTEVEYMYIYYMCDTICVHVFTCIVIIL